MDMAPLMVYTVFVGLPVNEWMQEWTHKSGYPIVSVDMNLELKEFIVQQRPSDGSKCGDSDGWWIPLQYTTKARDKLQRSSL